MSCHILVARRRHKQPPSLPKQLLADASTAWRQLQRGEHIRNRDNLRAVHAHAGERALASFPRSPSWFTNPHDRRDKPNGYVRSAGLYRQLLCFDVQQPNDLERHSGDATNHDSHTRKHFRRVCPTNIRCESRSNHDIRDKPDLTEGRAKKKGLKHVASAPPDTRGKNPPSPHVINNLLKGAHTVNAISLWHLSPSSIIANPTNRWPSPCRASKKRPEAS